MSMPQAWADLIEALTIMSKHPGNVTAPTHCGHDELMVMADPDEFTAEELARLEELSFLPSAHEGTFISFRFGSA